jgi:DNA-binding HxlR family transcriptional regulator
MSSPPTPVPRTPDLIAINAALIAVRQAAQVACDRATLLVMLHALAGASRFAEFAEQTGLASRLLSARLAQLTEDGLLVRIPYSRRPLRHAYHPTHMGTALFDVFAALASWERSWTGDADAHRLVAILHHQCTVAPLAPTTVRMMCANCQEFVTARDITLRVSQTEMAKMPRKSTTTRRTRQDPDNAGGDSMAPLPQGLAVLGDKWSIEVLVCAHFGIRQFGDFGTRLGISTNILTDRLNRLLEKGLLRRATDEEPHRKGLYLLTRKGLDFYPILIVIQSWADAWIDHRVRSPVKLRHAACQKVLEPLLVCAACGQPVGRDQAHLRLGRHDSDAPSQLPSPLAFPPRSTGA